MKIFVVGSGAREHAIAATLLRSENVESVTVAPGNEGMLSTRGIQLCAIDINNHAEIINTLVNDNYDLCIIGPEKPLMAGLADACIKAQIPVFGPTRKAAQLEGSKDFAKRFMQRHHIPTAQFTTFDNYESAIDYCDHHGLPVVIKADGLAAGKGVTVAMSHEEAREALGDIFLNKKFAPADNKVVIEDFLEGEEFSLMCFVHGTDFWAMPVSQDHKRAYDNDEGPNTGGMGAYSPIPHMGENIVNTAINTIIKPTLQGLCDEGIPFTGVLYAGLMATAIGPQVIEFNVRFGDPETEAVLPLLTSDLGQNIMDILHGKEPHITWKENSLSAAVVLASEGYPENPHTHIPLPRHMSNLLDSQSSANSQAETSDIQCFCAGVKKEQSNDKTENTLVSSSGRVLVLQSQSDNLAHSLNNIYTFLDGDDTQGYFYRHDIGYRALAASQTQKL